MPIKMTGRYDEGSAQERAHRTGRVAHVMDGWDVVAPSAVEGTWRGGY